MEIVVSDTSVLIDLERGELLDTTFQLDIEFVVPDLLYIRELEPYNGQALLDLGLRVEALQAAETALAQEYRQKASAISLPDSFALALAKERNWRMLTGDQRLRALADSEDVGCNGVLWVLDGIFAGDLMDGGELATALGKIAAHPRCRLPASEIRSRSRRYVRR